MAKSQREKYRKKLKSLAARIRRRGVSNSQHLEYFLTVPVDKVLVAQVNDKTVSSKEQWTAAITNLTNKKFPVKPEKPEVLVDSNIEVKVEIVEKVESESVVKEDLALSDIESSVCESPRPGNIITRYVKEEPEEPVVEEKAVRRSALCRLGLPIKRQKTK